MPFFNCRKTCMVAALVWLSLSHVCDASPAPTDNILPRTFGLKSSGIYPQPLQGGNGALPAPTGNLKAVTLGRGTQNYTCAAGADPASAPVAVGAVAVLYDATKLARFGQTGFDVMTAVAQRLCPDDMNKMGFPVMGHHHFNSAGVPIFDLGDKGLLHAKKTANVTAPTPAPGLPAAVPWLQLGDDGQSKILKQGYRIVTVGGAAPKTCKDQPGEIHVQYAAQYWFYE